MHPIKKRFSFFGAAIMLLLASCYSVKNVPVDEVAQNPGDIRAVRLKWETGGIDNLYLTDVEIKDGAISGTARTILPYELNIKKKNLAYAYLTPYTAPPDSIPGAYSVPLTNIDSMGIYKYDHAGTCLLSVGAVALGAILVIAMVDTGPEPEPEPPPSGSCPVIFAKGEDAFIRSGVIYGGAVLPWLERDDYLALPGLSGSDGTYTLKMLNEIHEVQNTNLAELIVADHPIGTQAILDKYGVCHTVSDPKPPVSASTSSQGSVLPLLREIDGDCYVGEPNADHTQGLDAMYLAFNRPSDANTAQLVIHAQNSPWLDYTMLQFCGLFGDKYQKWYRRQANVKQDEGRDFLREQNIPLSVYIRRGSDWQYVDYFPVTGPMAARDMVMPIDISGVAGDSIELKLECGAMFWQVDAAGMDFSQQQPACLQTVRIGSAVDERGIDFTAKLASTDREYYIMPDAGNEALLSFTAPPQPQGTRRTVFLHSRGHYEIIPDGTGAPNVKYLKTLARPNTLGGFSRAIFIVFRDLLHSKDSV